MDAPAAEAWRVRHGDRAATCFSRCAAFSAAPPSCHSTAASRWLPFPGLRCSLALRDDDPLRKPTSHACSRGQGWVSMAFEHKRSSCPCLLTHGYPSSPPCSQIWISLSTGWLETFFLLETFDPGLVLPPHSDRKGHILPVRRAPPQLPWPPDARRPTARCSVASCLPARSRVPVTRVCCPVHVCVDRTLPQHGERAHQALAVAKGHGEAVRARSGSVAHTHGPPSETRASDGTRPGA